MLDLIGEGLTNREIADRMFLAEKTVKNYISSLLAKIEVRGRTQAALFIAEQHRQHPEPTDLSEPPPGAGQGRSDAGPAAGR